MTNSDDFDDSNEFSKSVNMNCSLCKHKSCSTNILLTDGKAPPLSKGTKFLLLKIRGLVNKVDSLRHILSDNNIDLLCLNETFCDDTIGDNELLIEGLRIERRDRNRSDGGVAVYIAESLTYSGETNSRTPPLK